MKNYIGISRDHSGSMRSIKRAAARDYNETISTISTEATNGGVDTVVSVVKCGVGYSAAIVREATNSSVQALKPITESQYDTEGSATPLFDSVGQLIEQLQSSPDANNPDVSFMVMAITDGMNNVTRQWSGNALSKRIRDLQNTDRWTFVFRVPRGNKHDLVKLGIPEGNIQEWEQTEKGMTIATTQTRAAFTQYYSGLKSGVRSTKGFYTNLKDVDPAQLKRDLIDISKKVELWIVKDAAEGATIREFVINKLKGKEFVKGTAFYQLIKPEREVQDYKQIVIRNKKTGVIYGGANARDTLGLPHYGTIRLSPGEQGDWDVFVQSTSINRKLPVNSIVLHWPNPGL